MTARHKRPRPPRVWEAQAKPQLDECLAALAHGRFAPEPIVVSPRILAGCEAWGLTINGQLQLERVAELERQERERRGAGRGWGIA